MKCRFCGIKDDFYLERKYNGVERFTVTEIGKDDDGCKYVIMRGDRNTDEYLGVEEEVLRCTACDRIVLHDDEFSFYHKVWE